jgi:hypothetical protein
MYPQHNNNVKKKRKKYQVVRGNLPDKVIQAISLGTLCPHWSGMVEGTDHKTILYSYLLLSCQTLFFRKQAP